MPREAATLASSPTSLHGSKLVGAGKDTMLHRPPAFWQTGSTAQDSELRAHLNPAQPCLPPSPHWTMETHQPHLETSICSGAAVAAPPPPPPSMTRPTAASSSAPARSAAAWAAAAGKPISSRELRQRERLKERSSARVPSERCGASEGPWAVELPCCWCWVRAVADGARCESGSWVCSRCWSSRLSCTHTGQPGGMCCTNHAAFS